MPQNQSGTATSQHPQNLLETIPTISTKGAAREGVLLAEFLVQPLRDELSGLLVNGDAFYPLCAEGRWPAMALNVSVASYGFVSVVHTVSLMIAIQRDVTVVWL